MNKTTREKALKLHEEDPKLVSFSKNA